MVFQKATQSNFAKTVINNPTLSAMPANAIQYFIRMVALNEFKEKVAIIIVI
jgi:hypothetical protein